MRATSPAAGKKRKGVILLVVLAMITLLTILGITFVLYSDASEATARINMEGEKTSFQLNPADWSAGELMQMAFGQLVFDVEDDEAGQRSGLRGHSLSRDMYGYRYSGIPYTLGNKPPDGNQLGLNDRPFRGTGRLENDKYHLNFTTFFNKDKNSGTLVAQQIKDPERLGARTDPKKPNAYVGGFNPPYTYADLNHVFLSKLGDDGQVDEPSFVRREAMGTTGQPAPLGGFNGSSWDYNLPVWTESEGKVRIIRPRKAEHPFFPEPNDGWGDVRNLPWGTHNDAVWVDLGIEPKTAPNGRKFKPLFAFTVLDLDGRVNVNAHGNIHGRDSNGALNISHASRDGLGPWEVNLSKVLDKNPTNLFTGLNGVSGRHNSDGSLSGAYVQQNLWAINPQHSHGPLDGNAGQESALPPGLTAQPLGLPGSQFASPISSFGRFISQIYGGLGPTETTPIHEMSFHPFVNSGGNKRFGHTHFGTLMGRSLRSPTAWQNSELVKLGLFTTDPFATASSRDPRYDRVTTMSWDLDRPGMVPYLSDPSSQSLVFDPINWTPLLPGQFGYFNVGRDLPGSSPIPFPNLPLNTLTNMGEFDPFTQSTLALSKRLNLRRLMTAFPQVDQTTGLYTDPNNTQQAQRALVERQQFAQDIFAHLAMATGVANPIQLKLPLQTTDSRYRVTKWVAQLAANMVDFIDSDDVMTVFPWNNGQFNDAVIGVELSRLALNELYVQVENDPSDIGKNKATNDFLAKIYVELINPLLNPSFPLVDDHSAVLKSGNQNVHVLEVVKPACVPSLRDISQKSGIIGQDHHNVPGALIGQTLWDFPAKIAPAGEQFGTQADGKGLSSGFVVVGPKPDNKASDITISRWTTAATTTDGDIIHKDLGFTVPKTTKKLDTLPAQDIPVVLLRRLAAPGMPHQPDPAKAFYNPYVTIDMAQITSQMLVENDARKVLDGSGMTNPNMDKVDISDRRAYGRSQPYFGIPAVVFGSQPGLKDFGTLIPQAPKTPISGGPKCTFWRHNTKSDTAPTSFMAPVSYPVATDGETFETPRFRPHLDRWPSTVGEILSVPTCRAHEIPMLNDHRATYCGGWHDPATRLYRFLELAQAGSVRNLLDANSGQVVPVGAEGGRIPGKINVNTMTFEVFKALCDAQATTNRFSESQVDQVWQYLRNNRPYWGFGMGESTGGDLLGLVNRGMAQTLMRRHPSGESNSDQTDLLNLMMDAQNSFNNPGGVPPPVGTWRTAGGMELPPVVRQELLSKIIGNTTSRSNCFAVWLTVGFFEVVSDQGNAQIGNPQSSTPKHILGKELQPRVRRRMFCMVDRTMLEAWRIMLLPESFTTSPTTLDPLTGQLTSPVSVSLSSLTYNDAFGNQRQIVMEGVGAIYQSLTGKTYPVALGSVLTFDPGRNNEETVEVVDLDPDPNKVNLGVYLNRPHGIGSPVLICCRGNPGPVPLDKIDLDDLKNFGLIPYFQILE